MLTKSEQSLVLNALRFIAADVVTAVQLHAREEKYLKLESIDHAIIKLIMYTYILYLDDEKRRFFYFEFIRTYFNTLFIDAAEIQETIVELSLISNHRLVDSTINELCCKLNASNVDYYLVGAVPCYLATETPFVRFHNDIDIIVNEYDLVKVEQIFSNTEYTYYDKRYKNVNFFNSTIGQVQGEHEIIAYHKKHKFHIGFYLFVRGRKHELIRRNYFQERIDDKEVTMICDRNLSVAYSLLNYSDTSFIYGDTFFKMESLEGIYNNKCRERLSPGREKDYYDTTMIEVSGNLNNQRLKEIQSLLKEIVPNIYPSEHA